MFIAGLDKKKQEAFLNLAYTMIYADGKLDEREQQLFDSYRLEVEVDLNKAHKVDFEKELSTFDNSSQVEKNKIFFELYAIALIDDIYAEEEKNLVEMMKQKFNISDGKMKEMREGLKRLTEAYNELGKIVNV